MTVEKYITKKGRALLIKIEGDQLPKSTLVSFAPASDWK
jgi:hypothetical protein